MSQGPVSYFFFFFFVMPLEPGCLPPSLPFLPSFLAVHVPCTVVFFCRQDMTQVDLESVLPQTTVMVVSVTGSTTSGRPLSEEDLQECIKVSQNRAL